MILGIESTAHTFGVGVVHKGKVLANKKDMYTTERGGIIPGESGKHHTRLSEEIYLSALKEAKIQEEDIEAIAFSCGPGLSPCLFAGLRFAKEKSNKLGVPLVPVNHCIAHLEIA